MSAILREEPPDLSATNKNVQPGLERVVRHCLEKNPEERFHRRTTSRFDLEALSGHFRPTAAVAPAPGTGGSRDAAVLAAAGRRGPGHCPRRRRWRPGSPFAGRAGPPPPSFHQLTYRRGEILSARFAPDGQTVMYSAAWDGKPMEIFGGRLESPESRPFGLAGAEVLAISRVGRGRRLAAAHRRAAFPADGTLAQVSVAGGAPRATS